MTQIKSNFRLYQKKKEKNQILHLLTVWVHNGIETFPILLEVKITFLNLLNDWCIWFILLTRFIIIFTVVFCVSRYLYIFDSKKIKFLLLLIVWVHNDLSLSLTQIKSNFIFINCLSLTYTVLSLTHKSNYSIVNSVSPHYTSLFLLFFNRPYRYFDANTSLFWLK
jgi:hypothetical protein